MGHFVDPVIIAGKIFQVAIIGYAKTVFDFELLLEREGFVPLPDKSADFAGIGLLVVGLIGWRVNLLDLALLAEMALVVVTLYVDLITAFRTGQLSSLTSTEMYGVWDLLVLPKLPDLKPFPLES